MHEVVPWHPVTRPPVLNGDLKLVLATVDSLQRAWSEVIAQESEEEIRVARERNMRRHAIETGIIERLYDVDWGVTEALVAEGLSSEVAAREGGIGTAALATILAQFDALTYLTETVRDGHGLSITLIRRLHEAVCRTQASYDAQDQLGRLVQCTLHHGGWKTQRNFARGQDGHQIEFAPPEQVRSELERMIDLDRDAADLHPIVRAAWLHHAFVSIHPFEDGNGRVARALTLLTLLSSNYAPLVVDRHSRGDYMAALDEASRGDLRALVRLFARLEMVALRAELERPTAPTAVGASAVDIAGAFIAQLKARRERDSEKRGEQTERLAEALNARLYSLLDDLAKAFARQFTELDPAAHAEAFTANPPDERASWWYAQIVTAARHGDFFANLAKGTWWSSLRLTVSDQQFRYVTVVQKVGRGETGVLALTVFSEFVPAISGEPEDSSPRYQTLLPPAQAESVTFVYTDVIDERWPEVEAAVDRTLAAAIAAFAERLS
jgi:prophage maintenance system killer protein